MKLFASLECIILFKVGSLVTQAGFELYVAKNDLDDSASALSVGIRNHHTQFFSAETRPTASYMLSKYHTNCVTRPPLILRILNCFLNFLSQFWGTYIYGVKYAGKWSNCWHHKYIVFPQLLSLFKSSIADHSLIDFPLEKVKFSGIFDVLVRNEVVVTHLLKVIWGLGGVCW